MVAKWAKKVWSKKGAKASGITGNVERLVPSFYYQGLGSFPWATAAMLGSMSPPSPPGQHPVLSVVEDAGDTPLEGSEENIPDEAKLCTKQNLTTVLGHLDAEELIRVGTFMQSMMGLEIFKNLAASPKRSTPMRDAMQALGMNGGPTSGLHDFMVDSRREAVGDGSTVCPMNNSQNNMVGFWERPRAQSSRTERWHLVSILQLQAVQGEITAADEHVRDLEVDEVKTIAAIPSYPMPFVHDACSEWLARQEAQPLQEST